MSLPKPIPEARVEIYREGELIDAGYTDIRGRYITEIPPNTYTIKVLKTGYYTHEQELTLTENYLKVVRLKKVPIEIPIPPGYYIVTATFTVTA